MSSHSSNDNGDDDVDDQDDNGETYIYNAIIVAVKVNGFEGSVHKPLLIVAF